MISIIIRTYNEERLLNDLLKSIFEQKDCDTFEVIIVDSGSNDNTLSIAKQYETRIVSINKQDFTFGYSCNIGCQQAKGDILVFISGHCIPASQDWLNALVSPIHNDPKTAVSYGRQLPGPETHFSEAQVFKKYFPETNTTQPIPFFCNNANSAIRRSDWETYPFDESLTGLEDLAFAKKCVQSGLKVNYIPEAAVYHIHDESWKQVFRRYEREAYALKEIMPEIHLTRRDAIVYALTAIVSDVSKLGKSFWDLRKWTSICLYRICQFTGGATGHRRKERLSENDKQRYYYPV